MLVSSNHGRVSTILDYQEVKDMSEDKSYLKYVRYMNFAISFGISSIVAMLLGYAGGSWLDKRLGTTPVFMLIGLLLGIATTFLILAKEIKVLDKLEKVSEKVLPKLPATEKKTVNDELKEKKVDKG